MLPSGICEGLCVADLIPTVKEKKTYRNCLNIIQQMSNFFFFLARDLTNGTKCISTNIAKESMGVFLQAIINLSFYFKYCTESV